MTELGKKLKEAREAKGITLEQLQEMTKIQKRYLAAIEEGNYDILPGDFYVKAFIKQYAEAVGVSKEELGALQSKPQPQSQEPEQEVKAEKKVKAEKEEKKEKEEKTEKEEKPAAMNRNQKQNSPVSPVSSSPVMEYAPRILAIVVILGVLVAAWFGISRLNTSNDSQDTPTQQESTTNTAEGDQPEDSPLNSDNTTDETDDTTDEETTEPEEETGAQELTVAETSGNRSTMTLENADSFVITLTATGETYVEISSNAGKTYFSATMQEGQTETFDVSDEDIIEMNIGNTIGLNVTINDEELTYPINPNESVHQRITIERISAEEGASA